LAEAAIQLENVTRDFGAVRAVDDLSLEVPAGIVFGFLGPNGSGKTTTIRLLLGLLEPTKGRARVMGLDSVRQSEEVRTRSGALLEHTGLYERMTAQDNLEYYARIWQLPDADRKARVRELLTQAELWDRRKDVVQGWSRGMKQKLAIARVLIHRPSMIFLDEPTAGLDPVAAAELREHLAELAAREGATIFLTTHNLSEAERLCSQVAVIRKGKLLAAGKPESLRAGDGVAKAEVIGTGFSDDLLKAMRARPEVASVQADEGRLLLDLNGDPSLAPLVSLMVNSGASIEEVRKVRASLEEAFLTLMEEGE
jgi:ABC-2 type transport system ATP-binding protein